MSDRPVLPVLVVVVAAVLVGLSIVMQFVGGTAGGSAESSPGSTSNTGPEGVSGWAGVLERFDFDVRRVDDAFDERLPETGVLVSVLPEGVDPDEADALQRWLRDDPARRRLVLVGEPEGPLAAALVPAGGLRPAPAGTVEPVIEARLTAGIETLDVDPGRVFIPGDTEAVYSIDADHDAAYTVRTVDTDSGGFAPVVAVVDDAAVSNRGITQGENAGFAVRLVGEPDVPVYFDEYHHGSEARPGVFGFLPWSVQVFLLQVLFAGVVMGVGASVRFGPPLPEPEDAPRRRVEFVHAMARAYEDSGAASQAAELIRVDLRERLRRKLGLGAMPDAYLVSHSPSVGLAPADVGIALQHPVAGEQDLVAVAAAASRCRAMLASGSTREGA